MKPQVGFFLCDECENGFIAARSEEEAFAEAKARFGPEIRREDMVVLCDGCAGTWETFH